MPGIPTLSASPSLTAHCAEFGRGLPVAGSGATRSANAQAGDSMGGKGPQNAVLRNYSSLSGSNAPAAPEHGTVSANAARIVNAATIESIEGFDSEINRLDVKPPDGETAENAAIRVNNVLKLKAARKNIIDNLSPAQRNVFMTDDGDDAKLDPTKVAELRNVLATHYPQNGSNGTNGKVGPGVWAGVATGLSAALLGYVGVALYQKSVNTKQNEKLEAIANSLQQTQPQ